MLVDELLEHDGSPRPLSRDLIELLHRIGIDDVRERQRVSDLEILTMGISFTVYSDGQNIDRAWPFDIIPRLIDGAEWTVVEQGLAQRLRALNHFIDDVYNDRRIIADGVFPADLLDDSTNYRPECQGIRPKFGVWAHISGSDLVRAGDGQFYVLEDNLRVPSGVSYVLENRAVAKRTFPELFERHRIRPVDAYTDELNRLLASLAPDGRHDPCIAVLTPGIFNSAYFEHSFLAQRMGAELVEGQDLVVGDDDCVYMKTIKGLERVDVIYRRIDDLFIDPEVFRPDSMLGVARSDAGVEGGQRRHRQRARGRRRRRQGRVRLGAGHGALLPRRGAVDPERAHLPLHVRRRACATSSPTSVTSCSSRPTRAAGTAS
jgi:uncharacterized circularly permuted ATP-grasp superfamily protein